MLYYCENCSRVFESEELCPYCQGNSIILKKDAPVNVIGTKVKGRIFKKSNEKVLLIVKTEDNSKIMKEYKPKDLRKIL